MDPNGGIKTVKMEKPRDLPEAVGRKMVVDMKLDPDLVWSLKYVSRPSEGRPKSREFRIYNPVTTNQVGFVVKNWTSFDERPELVMYSGCYDKSAGQVDLRENA